MIYITANLYTKISEAIEWVKNLPKIDINNIGLWEASQAEWVIPKIVLLNKKIAT